MMRKTLQHDLEPLYIYCRLLNLFGPKSLHRTENNGITESRIYQEEVD